MNKENNLTYYIINATMLLVVCEKSSPICS